MRSFERLDLSLVAIIQKPLPFGGIPLLVLGDILQFSTVNQNDAFMETSKRPNGSFNIWLWEILTEWAAWDSLAE